MIRTQRKLHARAFYLLTPLLAALFVYALATRQRAAAHLLEQPARPSSETVP